MLASSNPVEVKSVSNVLSPSDGRVDISTKVELQFPNDVTASLYCNFEHPTTLRFIPSLPKTDIAVELEGGSIIYDNFPGPHFYHRIKVYENLDGGSKKKVETAYTFKDKGKDYWTTYVRFNLTRNGELIQVDSYRYMLEAFVDKLKGRVPFHWVDAEESIDNMH
jgi:hypothetical protein